MVGHCLDATETHNFFWGCVLMGGGICSLLRIKPILSRFVFSNARFTHAATLD